MRVFVVGFRKKDEIGRATVTANDEAQAQELAINYWGEETFEDAEVMSIEEIEECKVVMTLQKRI